QRVLPPAALQGMSGAPSLRLFTGHCTTSCPAPPRALDVQALPSARGPRRNRGPIQGSRKGGTQVKRFSQTALVLMLASAPFLAGCAMTPATTTSDSASAPSPGGSMGASTDGGRAVGSGSRGRSYPSVHGAARPNPNEFTAKTDLRDIRFDFDSYEIRTEDAQLLDQNADLMKANPGWLVLIEGHADQRGTTDYNLALSERRAR